MTRDQKLALFNSLKNEGKEALDMDGNALKVGDKVTVEKKAKFPEHIANSWVYHMDKAIGQTLTISDINLNGVYFESGVDDTDHDGYGFPPNALRKVAVLKAGAKVRITKKLERWANNSWVEDMDAVLNGQICTVLSESSKKNGDWSIEFVDKDGHKSSYYFHESIIKVVNESAPKLEEGAKVRITKKLLEWTRKDGTTNSWNCSMDPALTSSVCTVLKEHPNKNGDWHIEFTDEKSNRKSNYWFPESIIAVVEASPVDCSGRVNIYDASGNQVYSLGVSDIHKALSAVEAVC